MNKDMKRYQRPIKILTTQKSLYLKSRFLVHTQIKKKPAGWGGGRGPCKTYLQQPFFMDPLN